MLKPPDDLRQRCMDLSRLIEYGDAIINDMHSRPLWHSVEQREACQALAQRAQAWWEQATSLLHGDERARLIYQQGIPMNLPWDEAWALMLDETVPTNKQAQRLRLDTAWAIRTCFIGLVEHVRSIRFHLFPRSVVPQRIQNEFASGFSRIRAAIIDKLFLGQGYVREWWVPPCRRVHKHSADRCLGWLDGCTLYDPDHEVPLMQRVWIARCAMKRIPVHADDPIVRALTDLAQ